MCHAYAYVHFIMYIEEDNCVYYVDYMECFTVPYIRVLIGGVGCQCGAGIEATMIHHMELFGGWQAGNRVLATV